MDAEVRVLALRRDAQQTGLTGAREPLGDCALVAVGGVEVLLNTRRTQAFGTDLFTQFGVDLAARRIVVVKSSLHFASGVESRRASTTCRSTAGQLR